MFNLFGAKKLSIDKIETVIGSNTSFEGHLKCDGNIRIDGLCEGGIIETVGNVVVSPSARVAAKIIAEHVSVAGEVTGSIYARGHLEILSTGRVHGDVQVSNFYKDETGILTGRLIMGDDDADSAAPWAQQIEAQSTTSPDSSEDAADPTPESDTEAEDTADSKEA